MGVKKIKWKGIFFCVLIGVVCCKTFAGDEETEEINIASALKGKTIFAPFLDNTFIKIIFIHAYFHVGTTDFDENGFRCIRGTSWGVVLFPNFLKFHDYFRMEIIDISFNFISLIFDMWRCYYLLDKNNKAVYFLSIPFFWHMIMNAHLLSFEIFSFIRIKLFSYLGILFFLGNIIDWEKKSFVPDIFNLCGEWDLPVTFMVGNSNYGISNLFLLFYPRFQIDILDMCRFFHLTSEEDNELT